MAWSPILNDASLFKINGYNLSGVISYHFQFASEKSSAKQSALLEGKSFP